MTLEHGDTGHGGVEVEGECLKLLRKWSLSPIRTPWAKSPGQGEERVKEDHREGAAGKVTTEKRGGWMDPRRELGRRLGPVLVVVVVVVAIGALVGVIEGNATEGKDSGEVRIGSGKTFGEKMLPWATIIWAVVIGVGMWWLGWQQKKMAQGQIAWQKKSAESQLQQERELAERQEWLGRLEVRREALRAAMEYLRTAWRKETLSIEDQVGFQIEGWVMAGVFGKEEGMVILDFGKKAMEGKQVVEELAKEEGRVGGARPEELKRLTDKRTEVAMWVVAAFRKLALACWERKG